MSWYLRNDKTNWYMHVRQEMKKVIILIPVYNDWKSLEKLIEEINISINEINNVDFKCLIINDFSSETITKLKVPSNISSITLVNMKKNQGHARCNAFGIQHVAEKEDFDHLILMDGDGEDRPEEIKPLIQKALQNEKISIVAKRVERSEGILFKFLYQVHKLITFIFTGQHINFGNYSCLTKEDVKILSTKKSLWSSFSGSLKYHIDNLDSINSKRGSRYYGPSKMSFIKLIMHSFSIIAVFKQNVFLRSIIILIISSFFVSTTNFSVVFFQFFLVIFNLIIYLFSLRENKQDFLLSRQTVGSSSVYTH